jgi:hypothetical protein
MIASPRQLLDPDRRQLLTSMATITAAGIVPDRAQSEPTAALEVIQITAPARAPSDIEAWNCGLITAYRPELTAAENKVRNAELQIEIGWRFGLLNVRGRWIKDVGAEPTDGHAFLLIGNTDDSGNLKGFLRKFGRKFEQGAVIWKGYYRDVLLIALQDFPAVGMKNGDTKNLGRFHPRLMVQYFAMLSARRDGRWEDFGIWTQSSSFNRLSKRVLFDEAGNRAG